MISRIITLNVILSHISLSISRILSTRSYLPSVTIYNATTHFLDTVIYMGQREKKREKDAGKTHDRWFPPSIFLRASYALYSRLSSSSLSDDDDVTFSSSRSHTHTQHSPPPSSLFLPPSRQPPTSIRLTASRMLEVTATLSFVTQRHDDAPTQRITPRDAALG